MMKFNQEIKIGNCVISEDSKTFVIAEAGVNHNGDIRKAKKLIDISVESGAGAVKFQAFKSEELILRSIKKAPYQLRTSNTKESQFEMLKKLELTKEQLLELKDYCEKRKIIFLVTPFDEVSLNELNDFNLVAYKVSSTDITNLPFLRRVAKLSKPIILSTGMSFLREVELALKTIHPFNKNIILLQCTANYPIQDSEANLNVIRQYKESFNILVGFSDHTTGIEASPCAVAVGAKVIEKHFTLNKSLNGPDHRASLSPSELKLFIKKIRTAERFMGKTDKKLTLSEIKTRKSLQKCLIARRDIKRHQIFSIKNISAMRTGGVGISPIHYKKIFGRKAKKEFKKNEVIRV